MTRSRGPRTATTLLERAVIDAFAGDGRLSRVELARRTGLSRTVITALVAGLLDRGVLATAPPGPRPGGGPGRRPATYRLNRAAASAALVHAHRTHTSVTLMSPDGPRAERCAGVPWTRPWEEWSGAVRAALGTAEAEAGHTPRQVVLAVPFPVRTTTGDRGGPATIPEQDGARGAGVAGALERWWRGDPRGRLADLLGRPVQLHNDANLAALGEARYGAARDAAAAIHISVRHGLGAGIVIGGRLFTGALGTAGELAHVQVVEDGPYCLCGNRGCLATQTLGPEIDAGLAVLYRRPLTPSAVDALLSDGDPTTVRFLGDLGRLVARPVAGIVTMFNPDIIVIDATLGPGHRPFAEALTAELARHCPPAHIRDLRVVPGTLSNAHAHGALACAASPPSTVLSPAPPTSRSGGSPP